MMRVLGYLLLAALALLLQTVLLPPFFPGSSKPDLILLLAIWIALREPAWHDLSREGVSQECRTTPLSWHRCVTR